MGLYYYVDKHAGYNDNHVVHATGCPFLPADEARRFLGTFYTPNAAIQQARKFYASALGCEHCCPVGVKKNMTTQNSVALKHMVRL
ncbi:MULTISPECIES: hypothetical protein [Pantoea]|uniref:Uncharacterized protein n=1 Tax=Pantoea trifolii TaxID=2968030 RepID=A0ABT1VLJ3_9GAMM|nr:MULTISPECIES: hypothetical protein [unclassified Pantoea]MRT42308.1 hypothetical protein [Enterobacteriaceae bacterium RIT702]MCQ8227762.1 hypothetical protein [Pantoea sp. MMK2]MCQ8235935.1 hypothetical protein [Pantoea sp. MMK3]MCW6031283.1 hypothetical protein [Pantoea sp. JK]UVC31205.1 hypothetical protein NR302_09775 [Pantoea sp. SOD02]